MMNNLMMATQAYKKGQYRKALLIYQGLSKEYPKDALVYQGLAQCFLHLGQIDEAYQACIKALELDPQLANPLVTLASINIVNKQYDEAEQTLQRALILEPKLADAYIVLGSVSLWRHQIQNGILHIRKAIELEPNSWRAHFNLGLAYSLQQSPRETLREFWRAFRLSPSNITGYEVFVEYISLNRKWFAIAVPALLLTALIVHSIIGLMLVLLVSLYLFVVGSIWLKAKNYKIFIVNISLGILFLAFYVLYLLVLPPLF